MKKHVISAAYSSIDKKEYHPYDMKNPDFINSQKKAEYNDKMLHELRVPFEELPNFLKPSIDFADTSRSNTDRDPFNQKSKELCKKMGLKPPSFLAQAEIKPEDKEGMYDWIEKSVASTELKNSTAGNLFTGKAFDPA